MKTLKQAVTDIGGLGAAAAQLDISPQRLSNWLDRGVPTEQCARVELVLGVPRQVLRPTDWQGIWPELVVG